MVDNLSISIKWAAGILLYAASLIGMYYTMDMEVEILKEKVSRLEDIVHEAKLQALVVRVEGIDKKVNETYKKTEQIYQYLLDN